MSVKEKLAAREAALEQELKEVREMRQELNGEETKETPVPVKDFLSQEDADLRWILGGVLVPASINVLSAGGGVGKTTLLAQIALSLGAGRDVLGFKVYRPHTVLMIQAEGAREAFRQRLKTAARSLRIETPDLRGFIQPETFGDFIIKDGGIRRLVEAAKPDVAILDTIDFFHHGDPNSSQEWKEHVVFPLKAITKDTGVAWILVDHNRKANAKFPDDEEQNRGSSAKRDDSDLFLMLKKKKEADGSDLGNRTLWVDKNRFGLSDQNIPLWFDSANAIFREGHKLFIPVNPQ